MNVNLGEYLYITRRQKKLSILDLAAKSGINRNTISQIEGGDFMSVKLSTLTALCYALDVKIEFNLNENEKNG